MNVGSVFSISERSMMDDIDRMAGIAENISRYGTGGNNENDLVKDVVDMKVTQRHFEANANVIKTAEDMYRELLSLS